MTCTKKSRQFLTSTLLGTIHVLRNQDLRFSEPPYLPLCDYVHSVLNVIKNCDFLTPPSPLWLRNTRMFPYKILRRLLKNPIYPTLEKWVLFSLHCSKTINKNVLKLKSSSNPLIFMGTGWRIVLGEFLCLLFSKLCTEFM